MNSRSSLCKSYAWLISGGLLLTVLVTDARSQEVKPEAYKGEVAQARSLRSSVTALQSEVDSLKRANRELKRRLDQLAEIVPSIRDRDKVGLDPGESPVQTPTSDRVAEIREALRFSEDVMRIVEPELDVLRTRVISLEQRYGGHTHEYIAPPGVGWATWTNIQRIAEDCPDCLFPFRDQSKYKGISDSGHNETTGPNQ